MIRKTNSESGDNGQDYRLKTDRNSLPGRQIIHAHVLDTLAGGWHIEALKSFGASATSKWLRRIMDQEVDCMLCERPLVLDRSSPGDCRAIGMLPAENGIGLFFSICAACVKQYGGMEEATRMIGERVISDGGYDGQALTEAQYKAELKRARRQAKRRR